MSRVKHKQPQVRRKMRDVKNRLVKEGERVRIEVNVPSHDGMLYKDSIVTIDEISGNKARVVDASGKIHWVTEQHISASFL